MVKVNKVGHTVWNINYIMKLVHYLSLIYNLKWIFPTARRKQNKTNNKITFKKRKKEKRKGKLLEHGQSFCYQLKQDKQSQQNNSRTHHYPDIVLKEIHK